MYQFPGQYFPVYFRMFLVPVHVILSRGVFFGIKIPGQPVKSLDFRHFTRYNNIIFLRISDFYYKPEMEMIFAESMTNMPPERSP